MWKYSESTVCPSEVDKESSAAVVYIRRNIVKVEATEELPEMYHYEENIVPKEDWETYEKVLNHGIEIGEVQDAVVELAGLIVG